MMTQQEDAAQTLRGLVADLPPTALRVFKRLATAGGFTAEQLVGMPELVSDLIRDARAVADMIGRDVVDVIAEELYDVAHEHCGDEGCTGGGLPWYQDVAQLLVDPYGPVAAIAVQLHDIRSQEGPSVLPVGGARKLVADAWAAWLVATNHDQSGASVRLAAALAALVEATAQAERQRLCNQAAAANRVVAP